MTVALFITGEDHLRGQNMSQIRTLIAEDHQKLRSLLLSILQKKTQCLVVCEAADGMQAVQHAEELQPDLVLLDLSLPKMNGMEAGRRIRQVSPNSKILFLTQDATPAILQGALEMGALGFLLKSDLLEVPLAIEAILQGNQYVSARLQRLETED